MESNIFGYLLQVSIVFTLLFLLYKILVSNLTFHNSNRWVLLSLPVVSLIVPVLDIGFLIPMETFEFNTFSIEIPSLYEASSLKTSKTVFQGELNKTSHWSIKFWSILYFFGITLGLIRLVQTTKAVFIIKNNSTKYTIGKKQVFLADISSPFSYFHWIFIPKKQGVKVNRLIIEHEATHVKKMHSVDLLVTEFYAITFWFNPVIYLYRKSLKALHEFQADQGALTKNAKPSEYLELMLNTIQNKDCQHSLSYFNNHIIKKRIEMISKTQSKKQNALKYVILLVCIMLISMAFSIPRYIPTNVLQVSTSDIESTIMPPPSIFPLKDYNPKNITSAFGQKVRQPKSNKILTHQGIDIKAVKGAPVMATADGTIVKANLENEWGNLIVIMHSDGYQTWYAHLDSFIVKENQSIKKGEIIGYVGNTGLSKGPHLHYEVHQGEKTLNPMDFFE